ncbi:MAG: flagellar biosynthesis protein FliQ [Eubacterium sp.]|jgi:flagellar biosynthetic protein FliQ|nr:flagellar biosynthesis protein FliQ [Eubacterium sp.]
MTDTIVMELFNNAVYLSFKLAAPALVASLAVGLVIAILQAATQVHEQTLTFAPKVIIVGLVLLALGPWMINSCIDYINDIFELMATTTL